MSVSPRPRPEEVEHLLLNAQLRDEIEPYFDESITRLNVFDMPTPKENDLLASMLAWERAPIRPIRQWFDPELKLPPPAHLTEEQVHELLWDTIEKLYSKRIVLDFTDHLSDRQLYQLIWRNILPSPEKQIDCTEHYLHWDCANTSENPELWLRYYASDEERRVWESQNWEPLPPMQIPPYPRHLPRQAL